MPQLRAVHAKAAHEMVFLKRPYPDRDLSVDSGKYYAGNRFGSCIGMKTLQHPFFIVCAALWVVNQLLERSGLYIWPLHAYLDDLVCFPLILTAILAVQRVYFGNTTMTIPNWQILFALVVFTLCFEIVLPQFSKVYTADVLDVVAYSIGALIFNNFVNKPLGAVPVH